MTRAKKVKQARREERAHDGAPKGERGLDRATLVVAALGVAGLVAAVVVVGLASRGSDSNALESPIGGDPGPIHVHGLGVNPADESLFIATHTGLYRSAPGETKAERVGDLFQDTMGFSVAGPNRFLGSGHPDLRQAQEENLPPHLGLIESTDAGRTWNRISLLGEADFHVLRFAGSRVYGYDATNARIMISSDRGRTWTERRPPGAVVDIAIDPANGRHLLLATGGRIDDGLYESRDDGETWQRLADAVGLMAWPSSARLYVVTGGGLVLLSSDGGTTLRPVGDIGGQPAAFVAEGPRELYAALHDGTIKRSLDGGQTWDVRSRP